MGILIWKADEATCNGKTGYSNQFVELFKGDIDIHLKQKTSLKSKFNNALVTVYDDKKTLKELPITFGYSIRYETQICGVKAYQTKSVNVGPKSTFFFFFFFKYTIFF